MEDPVVSLERNLYGHPLAGLQWERQFDKVLLEHGWEKFFNWDGLFVKRARGLFLSVYVDDIKLAGKTENMEPTWTILMEDVDLREPTSLLDHVFFGLHSKRVSNQQRYCGEVQRYVRIEGGQRKATDQSFRET